MTRHHRNNAPKTAPAAPPLSPPAWYERREIWWLAIAVLLGVTWLVYMRGLTGGWLLDDYGNIVNNDALKLPRLAWAPLWHAMWSFDAGPLGRPLSLAGFALQRYFVGLDPYSFKAVGLGMHMLAALLFAGFTRALLRAWRVRRAPALSLARCDWTAFAIGAAWALHPFNLTPVLYAVQRETVQAALFTIGGLWAYVSMRERLRPSGPHLLLLAVVLGVFTFLGAFSKETGLLLPLFTFLLEVFVFGFRDRTGTRWRMATFYVIVLLIPTVLGLWWMLPGVFSPHAYATREFDLNQRILTEGRVM
ncbi:MAG TPA: hypothetical protein VFX38_08190, partial [Gammaproteobacteria bacterium]|nr:hypothetical protein [Gammaproteobacteria bacterium]